MDYTNKKDSDVANEMTEIKVAPPHVASAKMRMCAVDHMSTLYISDELVTCVCFYDYNWQQCAFKRP